MLLIRAVEQSWREPMNARLIILDEFMPDEM